MSDYYWFDYLGCLLLGALIPYAYRWYVYLMHSEQNYLNELIEIKHSIFTNRDYNSEQIQRLQHINREIEIVEARLKNKLVIKNCINCNKDSEIPFGFTLCTNCVESAILWVHYQKN